MVKNSNEYMNIIHLNCGERFENLYNHRSCTELLSSCEIKANVADMAPHSLKHLESSKVDRCACSHDNFAIVDQASSRCALKIKETLHILWEKPTLNAQVKYVDLKLPV